MNQPLFEAARRVDTLNDFPEHAHTCHEILFVEEGQVDVRIGDRSYTAHAPCLILISMLEPHAIHVRSAVYCRSYVGISPAVAAERIRRYTLLSLLANRPAGFEHVLDVTACHNEIATLFSRMIEEYGTPRPLSTEMQASLLLQLLICIYRQKPSLFSPESEKSISVIWQIQRELEEHYAASFSLDELAARYHISRCYLSHLFKRVTGLPLMQYLTMCRLSAARSLLVETNLGVSEILHRVGFGDSSNFSRLFKATFGQTPLQYRAEHR